MIEETKTANLDENHRTNIESANNRSMNQNNNSTSLLINNLFPESSEYSDSLDFLSRLTKEIKRDIQVLKIESIGNSTGLNVYLNDLNTWKDEQILYKKDRRNL